MKETAREQDPTTATKEKDKMKNKMFEDINNNVSVLILLRHFRKFLKYFLAAFAEEYHNA